MSGKIRGEGGLHPSGSATVFVDDAEMILFEVFSLPFIRKYFAVEVIHASSK